MARARGTVKGSTLLPENMRLFLQRRATEALGGVLFLAAILWAMAIGSFSTIDPSANNATAAAATNWLGLPGAYLADWSLSGVGIAALLPALVLACWGWRVASHQGLPWIWLNVLAAAPAVIALAAFAATLSPGETWPLAIGLGGLVGDTLLREIVAALTLFQLPVVSPLVSTSLAVLAALSTLFAIGIAVNEWRALARAIGWLAREAVAWAGYLLASLYGLIESRRAARLAERQQPTLEAAGGPVRRASKNPAALRQRRDTNEKAASQQRVRGRRAPLKRSKRARSEDQPTLDLGTDGDYQLPPLRLLQMPPQVRAAGVNADALEQNARLLESVLDDYGVRGRIVQVRPGPVVTLYELEPAPGTKSSRVIGLADDIARSMSAISVRVAVVPGRNAIGIELPNQGREVVYLRELLATPEYDTPNNALNLALGKDIGGEPVFADLDKMPHLLIAGTTGSGKSVGINTMILSLLYRLTPEQCRMILIDPKMLELSVYAGIPHLLTPVVTDPGKAVMALKWAVREMESRYRAMASLGVRNITSFNQSLAEAKARGEALTRTVQTGFDPESGEPIIEVQPLDLEAMPYIVVVVDEMADLMMVAGKEIEGAVQRLAQMARAAGIHVIVATQRPSVDVITGTIKANFPTRISFQVTSKVDSRTILGEQGAEQLLGQGDMLHMAGGGRIVRVHGPFVSDEEVEAVAAMLREQARPIYVPEVTEGSDDDDGAFGLDGGTQREGDELYDQAVDVVARHQKASTSFIQRHLKIGYNRAASLIDLMEEDGVIGPANHVGKREVFVRQPGEDEF